MTAQTPILPSGWKFWRLAEVAEVVGGSTPSSNEPAYWDGDIIWVTPTDLGRLSERSILTSERKISDAGYRNCGAEMVPAGSVVMSSRAPIGHLGIAAVPLCTNQGCKSFVVGPNLDSQFLFYTLLNFRGAIQSMGSGNTFKEVSKSQLESFVIPVPPLAEQKRIVSLLQHFFSILSTNKNITRRRYLLARDLKISIINTVFDEITKGTPLRRLDSLLTDRNSFADGPFGSKLKTSHYSREGARIIRLQNIGTNAFLDSDKAYIPLEYFEELKTHDAREGDVIVASLGDGPRPAGRACVVPEQLGPAIVKADCFRIRLNRAPLNPHFLCYFINSSHGRSQIERFVQGATRARLSLRTLRTLQVPVAAPAEQDRVVALLLSFAKLVEKVIFSIDDQRSNLEYLSLTLLRAVFSGQL